MRILIIPIFVSMIFVVGATLLFLSLVSKKEFEFNDEVSFFPLENDEITEEQIATARKLEKPDADQVQS